MYTQSPLISIICPCYNSGESLERMILSVLSQDYTNYELIVVDGKSSDGVTLGILEKYAEKIVCISEKDDGIYDAMNKGVELARGEWLYFIGADDYFYDSTVLNSIFGKRNNINEGVGLIVGRAMFGDKVRSYRLSSKIFLENTLLHQAVFYSRKIFLDGFRYNKEFRVSSDYDLNFYCYKQGFVPHYLNVTICRFSLDGISSQVHFQSYKEEMAVRKKYIRRQLLCLFFALYSYSRYVVRKIVMLIK
jgi:glycosyltransferase involved in cell wall biosynthesis